MSRFLEMHRERGCLGSPLLIIQKISGKSLISIYISYNSFEYSVVLLYNNPKVVLINC